MIRLLEIYKKLCKRFQWFEVISKVLYCSLPNRWINASGVTSFARPSFEINYSLEEFKMHLQNLGINKGDVILVHSAFGMLKSLGAKPEELIDLLISLVGEEGTVCFPCFPDFSESDSILIDGQNIPVYDRRNTKCWTGCLPNIFLKRKGVVRSSFPYNPIAACGRETNNMFANEYKQTLPHGKYSAWDYLIKRDAKILYLGCNVQHSQTIVHIIEDMDEKFKNIDGWYQEKEYFVKPENRQVKIKERKPQWAKYYSGYYCENKFLLNKLYVDAPFYDIPITYCPSVKNLQYYLQSQTIKKNVVWRLPHKLSKKEG